MSTSTLSIWLLLLVPMLGLGCGATTPAPISTCPEPSPLAESPPRTEAPSAVLAVEPTGLEPSPLSPPALGEEANVRLEPLDSLGRAQGVSALLDESLMGTGSRASGQVVGFLGEEACHDRGHLLASRLGGDGSDPRNLTVLYDTLNNGTMKSIENVIAHHVEQGERVTYRVTPRYDEEQLIPSDIHIEAQGEHGLSLDVLLINTLDGTHHRDGSRITEARRRCIETASASAIGQ